MNLQRIHRSIIDHLETEISRREEYLQREIQLLDQITDNNRLSPRSARQLRRELETVREKTLAHEKLLFYLAETSPLLEEYTRMLQTPVVKRGFMSRKRPVKSPSENSEITRRKREIYTEFLRIASNYCGNELDFTAEIPTDIFSSCDTTADFCEECGGKNITINVTDNMVCCMDCAYEFTMSVDTTETLPVTTNTDDSTRTNNRYEAILHFRSSMAKYQGKQQTTIPREVYAELHSRFARAGLLPDFAKDITFDELVDLTRKPAENRGIMGRLIRPERKQKSERSLPYNGAYSRITRDHIITFLQQSSRHEKHYEDLMLIHYTLTGVEPPNIGHLEAVLEQDFQILMGLYHQEYVIKQNPVLEDGKSFKSNYYILYHLLKKHGYRARRRDFSNMLKTPDREIFYDTVCKDLFGKLGWKFTSEF